MVLLKTTKNTKFSLANLSLFTVSGNLVYTSLTYVKDEVKARLKISLVTRLIVKDHSNVDISVQCVIVKVHTINKIVSMAIA